MKIIHLFLISILASSCVFTGGELQLSIPKKLPVQAAPSTSTALSPNSFTFNSASDYVASGSSVVVNASSNNLVKLLGLDQIDNLTADFQSGGLTGTEGVVYNTGNKITLDNTLTNLSELDKFWAPEYSHLIGYWKLNGAPGSLLNGDVIEGEIGNIDGVVAGTNLSYVNQKVRQAISGFGSGNDFIDMGVVPALSNLSEVTIGAWVYPTDFNNSQTIAGQELGYKLELRDNGPGDYGVAVFYIGDGVTWDCSVKFANILELNKWFYIVGTYNGSEITIYVNGIQGESCSRTGTTSASTHRVLIGGWDAPPATNAADPFKGSIDEVQIWNKGLTGDQVREITFKQQKKHSGVYYSRIMNGTAVVSDWTNLSVKIPYPLQPISTVADPAAYSGQTADFSTNLIALYHLDSNIYNGTLNEAIDSSGHGLHGTKTAFGQDIYSGKGLFDKAPLFTNVDYIEVPDDPLLDGVSQISFSIWAYRGDNMATSQSGGALYSKRSGYGAEHAYTAFIEDGTGTAVDGKLCVDIDSPNDRFCSNAKFPYFEWVHVVVTFDGTNADPAQRTKLYINGELDQTAYETSTSIPDYNSTLRIGALDYNYFAWIGMLDEFGIWNRTFTPTEVRELYRRGAHNVSMQVRTCTQADCSDRAGNSGWIGVDGTQNSFFTDLNKDSALTTPYFDFTTNSSLASWLSMENKQYFQYRTILESDSSTYLPEVNEVSVGPVHYNSSMPYVTTSASGALPFSSLTGFTQLLGPGGCAGGVTYQLANGVSGWKYWNGSSWATANTESDSNSATVVNANIEAFSTQFGSSTANMSLNLKTILHSNGSTACEVDNVAVSGLRF